MSESDNAYIERTFLEVKQPLGKFYVGWMKWNELEEIAYRDLRKIEFDWEKNQSGKFSYTAYGVQRSLDTPRIKKISEYVKTFDAVFPTSISLSIRSIEYYYKGEKLSELLKKKDFDIDSIPPEEIIPEENVKFSPKESGYQETKFDIISIRRSQDVASIIDGQHRLFGLIEAYKNYTPEQKQSIDFDLVVSIFLDIDYDQQAKIFSDINKAQTKVNKSLVYDLYDYESFRSPYKTVHDIITKLNTTEKSPFYHKVKLLGNAIDKENETITQATLAELILNYISRNPDIDRHNKKNQQIDKSLNDNDRKVLIFREYWINEEEDKILSILVNFFHAVKITWTEAWDSTILSKSTGIIALMRFLKYIFNELNLSEDTDYRVYADFFKQVKFANRENNVKPLIDSDFVSEEFLPGASGQAKLLKILRESLKNYQIN